MANGFTDAVGHERNRCLIYSAGTTGMALVREGTIDRNGKAFGYEADVERTKLEQVTAEGKPLKLESVATRKLDS